MTGWLYYAVDGLIIRIKVQHGDQLNEYELQFHPGDCVPSTVGGGLTMWLFTEKGFYSVVIDAQHEERVLVRSRCKADAFQSVQRPSRNIDDDDRAGQRSDEGLPLAIVDLSR